jgi:hypothetical protein
MTNKLIELIANKQFNEASEEFNSQIEAIAEQKIFEVKKMIAAKAFFAEGEEQLDEISIGTKERYIKAASADVKDKLDKLKDPSTPASGFTKVKKRVKGMDAAAKSISKNLDANDDAHDEVARQAHKDKIKAVDDMALARVQRLGAYQGSKEGQEAQARRLKIARDKDGGQAWQDWQARKAKK